MYQETLRFKKSTRSGGQAECVEVAHTLRHVRDSKNPADRVNPANTAPAGWPPRIL